MTKLVDTERRLVAIFAADVEGYSRLMGADEVGTMRDLIQRRAILDGLIAAHRGRIANTAGDSVLAEFLSSVDAVRCAVAAQEALAEANSGASSDRHINFRIGVHVGDVMVKGGDLFGDSVNIAARLQTVARAGGVCISSIAHDQVRKIVPFAFTDLGAQQVKNIEDPVRAFAVSARGGSAIGNHATTSASLTLPDKPSIAVLPFQNMSDDPEQEYFADGMVEDIITALSHFKSLFVIARNSSFAYKGQSIDIKRISNELGVRYVLEGSVRKAGDRVRITGQLIDATTGEHLWANKFDGKLGDVFDLQDQVTSTVAGIIVPRIEQVEIERSARKPTSNLAAYDYYLRALHPYNQWTRAGNEEAMQLLQKALDLDPAFPAALAWMGGCYNQRKGQGWIVDPEKETADALSIARRSLEVGKNDASALAWGGFTLAYFAGEIEAAKSLVDRSLQLNPNYAQAWVFSGWIRIYEGHPDLASEHFLRALHLNPLDAHNFVMMSGLAFAHFFAGRNDEAHLWAEKALADNPNYLVILRVLAASASGPDKARAIGKKLMTINPAESVSATPIFPLLRRQEDRIRWQAALRIAGLPD